MDLNDHTLIKLMHQLLTGVVTAFNIMMTLRDRPLENLWGQAMGKKFLCKGKLNEKNSCMPSNPENIHVLV